ncbi:hypothetical protein Sinac_4769 [Singulisphaera acidiphila DSM 18658]|uniref:Transposase n=1 Tax=Singulisphaera acidiphila (strain ATCC BAA-1392 / DSM 18658 / VKM B-2454 / MOB10) TaxID=886293 RepID=L0DJX6_SINAD|nr:hypothetical protein Sinac_4769 [Singulisphaera acidiphila DSM 18658]
MLLAQLLHAPIGSRLVRTDFNGLTLTLGIATTNPNASCPVCGHEAGRVHSRYTRCLAEEPAFGYQVCLQMTVRRFHEVLSKVDGPAKSPKSESAPTGFLGVFEHFAVRKSTFCRLVES